MTTSRDKILPALHRLSHAIARADSMESVCQEILKAVVAVIPVRRASIMKYDPEEKILKIVAAHGMTARLARDVRVSAGEGISGQVFSSKKPLLVDDIRHIGRKAASRYKSKSLMVAPVMCMPLSMDGKPVGIINVTDKRGRGEFTKEDLELLTTIANHTASYLHLTNLAESARKSEQLHHEVELARSIQQRLLPGVLPQIPNLDVAGICVSAAHVGGAGHQPPFFYSTKEKKFLQASTGDMILGVLPDIVFEEERVTMQRGDWMVLCTDGLYEASKNGKMLGLERVRKVIRDNAKGTVHQMLKALMTAVKKFVAPAPLKDDVTIVVAKVR